jgi:6-phosphogluconate dehydrogenase
MGTERVCALEHRQPAGETGDPMRFAIVGLGRMGSSLALNALEHGHEVVGYNLDADAIKKLEPAGLIPAYDIADLAGLLPSPRIVLVYVPHGPATTDMLDRLVKVLGEGDIIVDGGNSPWGQAVARADAFAKHGIHFLDMGTSGGVEGARSGAAFMVGGSPSAMAHIHPLLRDLAVSDGAVFHVSEQSGSGHFAKLIHNAIEFGMIQAIAEGVEMLSGSEYEIDLTGLLDHWNHGTIISSRLIELMGRSLREVGEDFPDLSTFVEDTGEVKWVVNWAMDADIPIPVTALSQQMLNYYRNRTSPQARATALLRNAFGGHPIHWRDGSVTVAPRPGSARTEEGPTTGA